MSAAAVPAHLIRLALDILEPMTLGQLPELVQEDSQSLRFRIRRRLGWRLRTVVFSKRALENLEVDPARDVKVDYLQRDMARMAPSRAEYRYPHAFGQRPDNPAPLRIALAR